MSEFSMLDEIEKYLIENFGNKINALENKQRVYEKVLKKSDCSVEQSLFKLLFY